MLEMEEGGRPLPATPTSTHWRRQLTDSRTRASTAIILAMPSDADPPPTYSDDLVLLDQYTADDVEAHLAGEDDQTARQFGLVAPPLHPPDR